jgi:large subunit ribosomal protein L15
MNLHSLENSVGARRKRRIVGRGMSSGSGKTSGSGHKGQMARKGHKHKDGFEGGQMRLIRRVPKRGFKNALREEFVPVNVGSLSVFPADGVVGLSELAEKNLVKGPRHALKVKVLAFGEIDRKLTVRAHAFSAAARTKIETAGGVCLIEGQ